MKIQKLGIAAGLLAFTGVAANASPIVSFGIDPFTGKHYVTQTETKGPQNLNVNSPDELITFQNFSALGISGATYIAGLSSFDVKWSATVTEFTVTNNDSTPDDVNAQIVSKVNLDSATTMPTAGANDRKNVTQNSGITYIGTAPQLTSYMLADTGNITIAAGATYTYPGLPVTVSHGFGTDVCGTFGSLDTASGCAASLTRDSVYSGAGSFTYGLTDTGAFSFAGVGATGNPHLSFVGTTNFMVQAEVTYEYDVAETGTPEPATFALFGGALVGLGFLRKRAVK